MVDQNDPFHELEYKMSNPNLKTIPDVANRNSTIALTSKLPVSKHVQLKAENYDLWFQNERLMEENAHLGNEHSKLNDKHDKLMYLARNRLGEIKNKYNNLEQDNLALRNELDN